LKLSSHVTLLLLAYSFSFLLFSSQFSFCQWSECVNFFIFFHFHGTIEILIRGIVVLIYRINAGASFLFMILNDSYCFFNPIINETHNSLEPWNWMMKNKLAVPITGKLAFDEWLFFDFYSIVTPKFQICICRCGRNFRYRL